jgi:hypothetical protein
MRFGPLTQRETSTAWKLDFFYRHGGNAVGPIEEVGIVGRPAGDKEEVLLWAFQCWNGRIRVVLQMLQLRMVQPPAVGIPGRASRAQGGLQRDAAVAVQPGRASCLLMPASANMTAREGLLKHSGHVGTYELLDKSYGIEHRRRANHRQGVCVPNIRLVHNAPRWSLIGGARYLNIPQSSSWQALFPKTDWVLPPCVRQ